MKNKSQSSIEFIIMIGVVIFFFVTMFLVINYNMSDKYRQRNELHVKNVASAIQDEILLASKATDGYKREFSIPNKILGKTYEAQITGNIVYVQSGKSSIALPIPEIIFSGEDYEVKKHPEKNKLEKENGEVKIS
jgi:hypothetical protein